jgi:hypothetical protein
MTIGGCWLRGRRAGTIRATVFATAMETTPTQVGFSGCDSSYARTELLICKSLLNLAAATM